MKRLILPILFLFTLKVFGQNITTSSTNLIFDVNTNDLNHPYQTVNIGWDNLNQDIYISSNIAGLELSTMNNFSGSSLTFTTLAGTALGNSDIYVRFKSNVNVTTTGLITVTSGNFSTTINVAARSRPAVAANFIGTLELTNHTFSGTNVVDSDIITFTVTASNLRSPLTITDAGSIKRALFSLSENSGYTKNLILNGLDGSITGQNIFIKFEKAPNNTYRFQAVKLSSEGMGDRQTDYLTYVSVFQQAPTVMITSSDAALVKDNIFTFNYSVTSDLVGNQGSISAGCQGCDIGVSPSTVQITGTSGTIVVTLTGTFIHGNTKGSITLNVNGTQGIKSSLGVLSAPGIAPSVTISSSSNQLIKNGTFTFNYTVSSGLVSNQATLSAGGQGSDISISPSFVLINSATGTATVTLTGTFVPSNTGFFMFNVSGTRGTINNMEVLTTAGVVSITTTPITFSGVRVRGNVSRTQPVVTWPTLAGANTYCIRLSKDSTMTSGVKTVCSLPGASYTVNATAPGARMEVDGEVWFYQVAGVDASGNQSPWSSNQTFLAVEITTSLEDESSSDIPVIYPNPFSDEINITQTTGYYQIVDLLGNVLLSGTTPKLNTSALSSGIYYLKTAKKVYKIVKN